MPASLLYQMFKEKTKYQLHAAIKAKREDVVFLYLIENDAVLSEKLNEPDEKLELPLDLALRTKQESIAANLVNSKVDIDKIDMNGLSLLHKAILRGIFTLLIDNHQRELCDSTWLLFFFLLCSSRRRLLGHISSRKSNIREHAITHRQADRIDVLGQTESTQFGHVSRGTKNPAIAFVQHKHTRQRRQHGTSCGHQLEQH